MQRCYTRALVQLNTNKRTSFTVTKRFVAQYKDSIRSEEGKDATYNQNPCFKEGTVQASSSTENKFPYRYVLSFENKEFPLTTASITSSWEQQQKDMINLEPYKGQKVQVFGFFPEGKFSTGNSFICEATVKKHSSAQLYQ